MDSANHIVILCDGHLSMNPRVVKEASALHSSGYRVTVLYQSFDVRRVDDDIQIISASAWDSLCYLDLLNHPFSFWWRLRRFAALKLLRAFGLLSPDVWGYGPWRLLRFIRQLKPDLVIAHRELGLWSLHSLRHLPILKGCDVEDWFSDDSASLQWPPVQRIYMQRLECWALNNCSYRITTSETMALELSRSYSCKPPVVVVNSFELALAPDRDVWTGERPLRLHWFSQTIGPGRGLELIFAALNESCLSVELHLRGDLPHQYRSWLRCHTNGLREGQVVCHPRVAPADLSSSLQSFDIGLALETPETRSRALTSTNKIFQYMEAGLPVLATATPGQCEVLERLPRSGWLIPAGFQAIDQIRKWLNWVTDNPWEVGEATRHARNLPMSHFGWRHQQQHLVQAAQQAFAPIN